MLKPPKEWRVCPLSVWEVGEWEEGSFRKEMEAKWNHECGPLFIL